MKKIDTLIPYAFEAVGNKLVDNKNSISSEYNGYIASFGASVRQSGIKAALVFNHRDNSDSEKDRKKLMDAIYYVVKKMRGEEPADKNLLEYAFKSTNLEHLKKQILDASTAIKLVIRTYKLVKND